MPNRSRCVCVVVGDGASTRIEMEKLHSRCRTPWTAPGLEGSIFQDAAAMEGAVQGYGWILLFISD